VHNFSDVRAAIDVQVDGGPVIENNTLHTAVEWETGHNVVYNNTTYPLPLELEFIVNGKGATQVSRRTMQFTGHRCIGPCNEELDEDVELEPAFRLWSNPSSWPSG
jgi:hypothetical protein